MNGKLRRLAYPDALYGSAKISWAESGKESYGEEGLGLRGSSPDEVVQGVQFLCNPMVAV